ncbi:MAG: hypothetical protein C4K58_08595 [Flavobacteriaceae bacterium]|nr:MAG: hypothetical protein C4K58_08595 [Flavobacteriaceae bacterium]
MSVLDSKIPEGPLKDKWTNHKNKINVINPSNKRLIDVIVVGTGLAGGAAAASLAELGYNVKSFCYQDSPRRAHSIAAQGGINAAKNYQGDGDSTYRLFYDTINPYTVGDYLASDIRTGAIPTNTPEFDEAEKAVTDQINHFINNKGTKPVDYFHRRLGKVMWDKVGMSRNPEGLKQAIEEIRQIRKDFWENVRVPGTADSMNPELEKAGRVADFLELGELFARDALAREESCGGHFREDHATEDGEAARDDANFAHVSAWEYKGDPSEAVLHIEPLVYENIELKARSYK